MNESRQTTGQAGQAGQAGPAAPKPPRARNRRGEGGRLREDIISAAAELLDETGDERAITLRSVARRVGIAAPSIYPHFPDQPAIMLAVVQGEFARLSRDLHTRAHQAGDDPRRRLLAVCEGYLEYARSHPERYRTMFGGLWVPTLGDSSVTADDLAALGDDAMGLIVDSLAECVATGQSTSTDPLGDAFGLWLGMHGLAHQRASTRVQPWPEDIADRMIGALAHLDGP